MIVVLSFGLEIWGVTECSCKKVQRGGKSPSRPSDDQVKMGYVVCVEKERGNKEELTSSASWKLLYVLYSSFFCSLQTVVLAESLYSSLHRSW